MLAGTPLCMLSSWLAEISTFTEPLIWFAVRMQPSADTAYLILQRLWSTFASRQPVGCHNCFGPLPQPHSLVTVQVLQDKSRQRKHSRVPARISKRCASTSKAHFRLKTKGWRDLTTCRHDQCQIRAKSYLSVNDEGHVHVPNGCHDLQCLGPSSAEALTC